MENLVKKSAQSALFGAMFVLGAIGMSVAYAALNYLAPMNAATSGSGVSANEWNKMVANFTTVDSKLAAVVPTGAVMAFNLSACPTGWSPFSQANGKTVVGTGNDGQGNAYALLNTGGEARHTLTIAEMPSHNHGFSIGTTDDNNSPWNVALLQLGDNGPFSFANFTTAAAGGGGSHENRMPYVALLYCVKD